MEIEVERSTYTKDKMEQGEFGEPSSKKSKHVCDICTQSFDRVERWANHVLKKLCGGISCRDCQKPFNSLRDLERHKKTAKNSPVFIIVIVDFAQNTNIRDINAKLNQYTNLLKILSMKLFFHQSLMVFLNMRNLKGSIMESLKIALKSVKGTPNIIEN